MLKTTIFLSNLSRIFLMFLVFLLFLVLPQINIPEYVSSTITSKFIYFLYGCIILLGFYILHAISNPKKQYFFSKLDFALFALLTYITLNRYFIQSHYGFSIRYIELLGLSFLYIILRSINGKNYPWLLITIVISGIIQAVYGNLQLLGYYPSNHSGFKMTGSFFNPGPYAGFLVSVWAVALGMYLFKNSIIVQFQSNNNFLFLNKIIKYTFDYIPLLGIISIAMVLPATQSRASWIAAIVSSSVLIELRYNFLSNLFKKVTTKLQKTGLIVIAFGILIIGFYGIYHFKKSSSDGRILIWKITTKMISDVPVYGVGFDQFKAEYMNYQANYFAKNKEISESLVADNAYYAFNEGLQFVSENGMVGMVLLFTVIYILFLTKLNEKLQSISFIAKTGLLTIGVFACFSYPMQILPIKLVLIFLLALLSKSAVNTYQINIEHNNSNQWWYKIAILLVSSITIFQVHSYTNDLNQGFITWNNALISHQYGDYKGAILEFETAYPIFKKDGDFLMNYGKTLSMAREYTKAIPVLEKAQHYQNNTIIATALGDSYKATKQYDKAEASYQQAINITPGKFYANYLLAKLYDDSGQHDKAILIANKLLNKKIKISSTAIKEIRREMKRILIKYKNPPGI